jgi:general secretion pathway protein L
MNTTPRGPRFGDLISRAQIDRFVHWWISELVSLLPPRLRQLPRFGIERLILQIEDPELVVSECKGGVAREVGRYRFETSAPGETAVAAAPIGSLSPGSSEVVLRLSALQALCKTLILPQAAEENLREVLEFEMDRQTPFTAAEVYHDFHIAERIAAKQQLHVKLVVVPRQTLDTVLDRVARFGVRPDVVDVLEAGTTTSLCADPEVNLLPFGRRSRKPRWGRWLNLALAALAGLLLLTAVFAPLVKQRTVVAGLRTSVDEARREAEAVAELDKQINRFVEEAQFLIQSRRQSPSAVVVLNELTRVIPDDTWISTFELKGSTLEITGQSPSASTILGLVEASSLFQDARFLSAVTKDPTTGKERFELSAKVTSGSKP